MCLKSAYVHHWLSFLSSKHLLFISDRNPINKACSFEKSSMSFLHLRNICSSGCMYSIVLSPKEPGLVNAIICERSSKSVHLWPYKVSIPYLNCSHEIWKSGWDKISTSRATPQMCPSYVNRLCFTTLASVCSAIHPHCYLGAIVVLKYIMISYSHLARAYFSSFHLGGFKPWFPILGISTWDPPT